MQSLQLPQPVAEVEATAEVAAALAWKTGSAMNGRNAPIICKQEVAATSIIAAQYSTSSQKQNFAQQKNQQEKQHQQEKQQKKAMEMIIKNRIIVIIKIIYQTLPVSY